MRALCFGLIVSLAPACAGARVDPTGGALAMSRNDTQLPRTRAELSGYTETSRFADVVAFLDSLRGLGAPIQIGTLGVSGEGRRIPYVIASRPLVRTPEEAQAPRLTRTAEETPAHQRPVVLVQANIHGGEVEGKEALQMLLRDLVFEQRPNVLDSIVLIAVPIYNVDGNEAFGPQERNRPEQNGPPLVGRRTNAGGLDLNRDYMKAEAPETRASLALFNAWNPDLFVDLHTTNGSFHGYALTYSPPLNPAAPEAEVASRALLGVVRTRMRVRHGLETFEYGNFGTDETPWRERAIYTPAVRAWTTFDSRPRFSTNYYGVRGGLAVLSEAYSHDPFNRRVAATYAFVGELLSAVAARWGENGRHGSGMSLDDLATGGMVIRGALVARPDTEPILVETVERTGDSVRYEAGLAPGIRRTGRVSAVRMPAFTRFEAALRSAPADGYIIPSRLGAAVAALRAHGIAVERVGDRRFGAAELTIDSVTFADQPFEGHREARVHGRWRAARSTPAADDYFVSLEQPLGRLATYLLEPRSDDGLTTWNFFDSELTPGERHPVRLVPRPAGPGN